MFDFYFGDFSAIQKDEIGYLLTVRRMLLRWCNSIPDSEFIALSDWKLIYFARETKIRRDTGMERADKLEKRFAAWKVFEKKETPVKTQEFVIDGNKARR